MGKFLSLLNFGQIFFVQLRWNWFSVRLPVTNAWNWYSLYSAFSGNVRAWGNWAFSLFLSFFFHSFFLSFFLSFIFHYNWKEEHGIKFDNSCKKWAGVEKVLNKVACRIITRRKAVGALANPSVLTMIAVFLLTNSILLLGKKITSDNGMILKSYQTSDCYHGKNRNFTLLIPLCSYVKLGNRCKDVYRRKRYRSM